MKKSRKRNWTALALGLFVLAAAGMTYGCGSGEDEKEMKENLKSVVSGERLVSGAPVSLNSSPIYVDQAVTVTAPENVLEEHATGSAEKTVTVTRDEKYGGGQFIEKLFTEALSRAASGSEFSTFQQYIVDHGYSKETLGTLAKAVFESEAFDSFGLNRIEKAFCLYRAVLSRDPTEAEVMGVSQNNVSEKIDELIAGEEFAGILGEIQFGPYSWRGNNRALWTGETISMSAFKRLVENASSKVVELPQGSLILVDSSFTIPAGYTIRTEGNPDHYVRFARFLRTSASVSTLSVISDTVLSNLFTDGNRKELSSTAFGLPVAGNDNVIWGCRLGESTAPVHANPGTSNLYIGKNLVTQYSTVHSGTGGWADGIDVYAYNSIVEYNHVVDATDGGIVLFRAQEGGRNVPQNSIVRYNTVCNTGNSCYCGIDNEGVDMDGKGVADFTGTVIYGNALYTSYVAHMHMCLTLSSRPWTTDFNKVANNSVLNNYSPKGCFVNTAGGIIVEGADHTTVRGNQFEFRLGNWTTNFLGKRFYSVNSDSCEGGDHQDGSQNWSGTGFISPVMDIEKEVSVETEIAYVYEAFIDIPASKFSWILKS